MNPLLISTYADIIQTDPFGRHQQRQWWGRQWRYIIYIHMYIHTWRCVSVTVCNAIVVMEESKFYEDTKTLNHINQQSKRWCDGAMVESMMRQLSGWKRIECGRKRWAWMIQTYAQHHGSSDLLNSSAGLLCIPLSHTRMHIHSLIDIEINCDFDVAPSEQQQKHQ